MWGHSPVAVMNEVKHTQPEPQGHVNRHELRDPSAARIAQMAQYGCTYDKIDCEFKSGAQRMFETYGGR